MVAQAIRSLGVGIESFYKNKLPLLEMAADLILAVNAGSLPASSALLLNRIADENQRRDLTEQAIREGLSRNQLGKILRDLTKKPEIRRTKSFRKRFGEIATWADQLDLKARKDLERLLAEIDKLRPNR